MQAKKQRITQFFSPATWTTGRTYPCPELFSLIFYYVIGQDAGCGIRSAVCLWLPRADAVHIYTDALCNIFGDIDYGKPGRDHIRPAQSMASIPAANIAAGIPNSIATRASA